MKALVVYDSFFGNTERVARAIGAVLGTQADVEVVRVTDLQPEQLSGLGLLVVGSPTRAFRPSPAVSAFLKRLPDDGLRGVRVAAFDTRVSVQDTNSRILGFLVGLLGYAAQPMAARLRAKGGEQAAEPEGFLVQAKEGPLNEGELERVTRWAEQLLQTP